MRDRTEFRRQVRGIPGLADDWNGDGIDDDRTRLYAIKALVEGYRDGLNLANQDVRDIAADEGWPTDQAIKLADVADIVRSTMRLCGAL